MILRKFSSRVVCSPYKYILWPTAISFIISYPFLNFVLSDPLASAIYEGSVGGGGVAGEVAGGVEEGGLFIRQAVLFPSMFDNPIEVGGDWEDELMKLNEMLTKPVEGSISSTEFISNLQPTSPTLSLFTNLTEVLKNLSSPYIHFLSKESRNNLKTSQYSLDFIQTLLFSPRMKNNQVQSSRGLLLSYVSNTNDNTIWNSSISSVCCEKLQNTIESIPSQSAISFNISPNFPTSLLPMVFIYSIFAVYKDIVFTDTRCIRSKIGLVIAQVVQILLAIFSSATITSFIYSQFCFSNLYSFISLPFVIITGSIENMLELINTVSRSKPESSPITRVTSSTEASFPKILKLKATTCGILIIGFLANFNTITNSVLIFTILSIIIDLILHVTFFTAVLSVDLHRLELDDLLSTSLYDIDDPFSRQYKKFKGLRLRSFLYLNYLTPRQRFPIVISLITVIHILFTFTSNNYIIPPQRNILFINQFIPSIPTIPITMFNPIVLSYNEGLKCFNFYPSLSTTASIIGGYSIHIVIEAIVSLSFILSIAALILKILLPKHDYNESTLLENDKFSSKDLVGYHTLDVIQIVVDSSYIATVSLDHGICVWNIKDGDASKKNCKFRTLPTRLWPVSKVLLNGFNSTIVIISCQNSIIEAWDFNKSKIMYSIKDESILSINQQPYLSFIVGRDTAIITKSGAFIMISNNGSIDIVCPDLTFERDIELITTSLLITPKLNDKIVCLFSDNSVIVITHIIGKQWNFRSLELLESLAMDGKGETILYRPYPSYPPIEIPEESSSSFIASIPCTRPVQITEKPHTIIPVPTIHMVLLVAELTASLFDVHTGVVVRHFQLGLYKPGSLRVFHAHPTHCRFCGCASINSISIAYDDLENKGLVICHTVQIENRAKNNICLRVERDPRETRCLGFEAASENLHWIDRVEGWDATDINMMMGVRRKEAPRTSFDSSSSTTSTPDSGRMSPISNERDLSSQSRTSVFRRITSKLSQKSDPQIEPHERIKHKRQKKPPLNITWEGWAMTGKGEVSYYDIPDVEGKPGSYSIPYKAHDIHDEPKISSRLLIRTVGPTVKYGKKSIAVAFGNVIKILYFGSEEFHDESVYANRLVGTKSFDFGTGSKRWKREVAY